MLQKASEAENAPAEETPQGPPLRYYQAVTFARDGVDTGLWHYTVITNGYGMATGNCAQIEICPECNGLSNPVLGAPDTPIAPDENGDLPAREVVLCMACDSKGYRPKADACPGHETEEGACEHFKEFMLDKAQHNVRFEISPCAVCGSPTTRGAKTVAHLAWHLCRKHNNRDGLSTAIGKIGNFIAPF